MAQPFDSSGYYNHGQYYAPDHRVSSDWSSSPSASTPMTRDSSRESAITTYSDIPAPTPSSEYDDYNSAWPSMHAGSQSYHWLPISDPSHDITYSSTPHNPSYSTDTTEFVYGNGWWEYYKFVTDVEPNQQPYWKLRPEFQPTDQLPVTRIAEDLYPPT
ncbi:hypothetical protein RRF57_004497 [Xylaria bambusicola]|uniref:Uncharacterized protein n=1 Tax=Xylaria bambusicola TaxID=326684 RepID=A0AAN7UHV5_9PEZI